MKRKPKKHIMLKVVENIQSGFFTFDLNDISSGKKKSRNKYRIKCPRDCENCNLAAKHIGGSDCMWHPDSEKYNLDFIRSEQYPEFFI